MGKRPPPPHSRARMLIFRVLVMAYLITGGLSLLYGTLAFVKPEISFLSSPWLLWVAGGLALLLGIRLESQEAKASRSASKEPVRSSRWQRLLGTLAVALVAAVLLFIVTLSATSKISTITTTTTTSSLTVTTTLTKIPAPSSTPAGSALSMLSPQGEILEETEEADPVIQMQALAPKAPGTFRVAAVQFVSDFGNLKGNRQGLEVQIREAARHGAQIVVMPEAAIQGYMSHDLQTTWRDPARRPNLKDGRSLVEAGVAEAVPGESTQLFGGLARELKLRILVTLIECVEKDGRSEYFNAAVLLSPEGALECHYRKLNPWPPGEATWAQDGDRGLGLCDTEFGRLGILICYDLSKGVVTRLKEAGATTLLYPIGWVDRDARAWFDHELPRRIGVWKLPLVGANWSLPEPPPAAHAWQGYGHSRIYSAAGTILARGAATGTEILYADLPLPDPLRLE